MSRQHRTVSPVVFCYTRLGLVARANGRQCLPVCGSPSNRRAWPRVPTPSTFPQFHDNLHPAVELPRREVLRPNACIESILERLHLPVQDRKFNPQSGHDLQDCPTWRFFTTAWSSRRQGYALCPRGKASSVPVEISLMVEHGHEKWPDDIEVSASVLDFGSALCTVASLDSLHFLCGLWIGEIGDVSLSTRLHVFFWNCFDPASNTNQGRRKPSPLRLRLHCDLSYC